jgi:exopolysaccharide production protein ExoZ
MHATKIESVQALRAAAALSVAILHVLNEAISLNPGGMVSRWHNAFPWTAGVDLFFVISGFVMVYASGELFGRRDAPALFMARRLIRIVPLYWAATTLFVLAALTARSSVSEGIGSIVNVAASYLFLPTWRPDGTIQPIYSLGWTLNYEMFFYAVFAASIWQVRHRALGFVTLVLAVAMALHRVVPAAAAALVFWTDPIVAEFLFGMAIAAVAGSGISLPDWARVVLIIVALVLVTTGHLFGIVGSEPIVRGAPMAMLVTAAVLGRVVRVPGTLLLLGNASYALYLVHPFAMRAMSLLWHWLELRGTLAAVGYIAVSLLLAIVGSIAVFTSFERPVGAWLRARVARSRLRQAPVPGAAV